MLSHLKKKTPQPLWLSKGWGWGWARSSNLLVKLLLVVLTLMSRKSVARCRAPGWATGLPGHPAQLACCRAPLGSTQCWVPLLLLLSGPGKRGVPAAKLQGHIPYLPRAGDSVFTLAPMSVEGRRRDSDPSRMGCTALKLGS